MLRILLIVIAVSVNIYSNGFVEAFIEHPDSMERVPQDERSEELLERYKPRIFVHRESYLPMDFYMDYLPNTVVKRDGILPLTVEEAPGREELREYSQGYGYFLDLRVPHGDYLKREADVNPAIYGRVYRDRIEGEDYLFLKYNLVFPYSGLPADISTGKKIFSGILGRRLAWHQLDIHGAYHLVIRERDMEPVGILINQHNHHRVYILGRDRILPEDGRAEVAIAQYSNEPYLWRRRKESIKTAGNPRNIEYIFDRTEDEPLDGGRDYIGGESEMDEIETVLQQLPSDDPLYTSRMYLGSRRRALLVFNLWYLDGPPGMDYYSYPALKNLGDLFSFWYIDPDDDEFFRLLTGDEGPLRGEMKELLLYQRERMAGILREDFP